jgi:hypothetical protein
MKSSARILSAAFLCAFLTCGAAIAQIQSSSTSTAQPSAGVAAVSASPVPSLVNYSGLLKDSSGRPVTSITGVTFLLYKDSQSGAPVWMETQNVTPDKTGRYTVQLGSTTSAGLPSEVFLTGEARWLGVQMAGETEQPRVLLVAVPYAMKAGDAATIGGLPPSAFLLAAPGGSTTASVKEAALVTGQNASPATPLDVTTLGGTVNYLPLFSGTATIVDSVLFQSATAPFKIGINTTTPTATLDVKGASTIRGILSLPVTGTATAAAGKNSQPLSLAASAYNSSTPAAVSQTFRWQAEPAGNNTATPSGTLNLLFGEGTATPAETGLNIGSNGQITFATGQTFPGVVQLDAANTFTGDQTVTGTITATTGAGNAVSGSSTLGSGVVGTAGSNVGAGVYGSGITGVQGVSTVQSGTAYGVLGTAASPTGVGVEGLNKASSGGTGVLGTAAQFGVYGTATGTGKTVGVFGSGADGVQGSGTVYGVYGASSTTGATGVYGTAPQFGLYGTATGTGSTVGVFGSGADGLQGSGTSHGVYAAGTGAGSYGVYGTAPSFGVYGLASNTSGTAVGVFGAGVDGLQGSGSAYGVYAAGTGATSTGVYGTSPSLGLYGVATNTTGSSIGVLGSGGSNGVYGTAANFGLYGVATATSGNSVGVFGVGIDGLQGSGSKYGVYAATSAGTAGTYGVYGAPSLLGSEGPWDICLEGCGDQFSFWVNISNQAGVWADSNSTGGSAGLFVPALLATADANVAAVVLNNTTNWPGALFYNWGGQDYTGGGGGTMGDALRAGGPGGTCTLTGSGDTACTGVLKSVVATKGGAGAQRVETYAVQSAENWFEDAGTAQIVNGVGRVNLESVFGQTVNTGVEYHVFLTPDGDCKGLYVSAKTASGFEVRELGGGAASIAFEYRIMAKRAGYESVRLTNVTERFNRQAAQNQKIQRPARASSAAQSGLVTPLRAASQPVAAQPK